MEVAHRARPRSQARIRTIGGVVVLVIAAGAVLAWAFLDVRLVDEYPAALSFQVAVCRAAVPTSDDHDVLAAANSDLIGAGTVRVHANHLNYRRYEFVTGDGTVVPLEETEGNVTRRHCV